MAGAPRGQVTHGHGSVLMEMLGQQPLLGAVTSRGTRPMAGPGNLVGAWGHVRGRRAEAASRLPALG